MKFTRDQFPLLFPGFDRWQVPEMPDLSAVDRWQGPWQRDIRSLTVDVPRSKALSAWDAAVTVNTAGGVWEGSARGMPVNVVSDGAKTVKVLDLGGKNKIVVFGRSTFDTFTVADMGVLLREGDPSGGADKTARVLAVDRNGDPVRLVEMIQVERPFNPLHKVVATAAGAKFVCGWVPDSNGGRGHYEYDLRRPWTQSMGGTSAGNAPNTPLLLRWDEIDRGHISHCLFGVPANYSTEPPTGWASGTDGRWLGYPLRAGDILRLREDALGRVAEACGEFSSELVIAQAMRDHGVWIGDKYTTDDPYGRSVKIKQTMDRRWSTGTSKRNPPSNLRVSLADFEVVVQ